MPGTQNNKVLRNPRKHKEVEKRSGRNGEGDMRRN
jgi:hypothetical protein